MCEEEAAALGFVRSGPEDPAAASSVNFLGTAIFQAAAAMWRISARAVAAAAATGEAAGQKWIAAAPFSLARSLGKARCSRHRSRGDAKLSGRPRPLRRLPPGSSPDARGPRPPGLSWQQLHH